MPAPIISSTGSPVASAAGDSVPLLASVSPAGAAPGSGTLPPGSVEPDGPATGALSHDALFGTANARGDVCQSAAVRIEA